jgi:hypothetical protein
MAGRFGPLSGNAVYATIGKRYGGRMQYLIRATLVLTVGYLIADGTLVGQSRDDLVRKYGQPRCETFVISPGGVQVSATYEDDGRIKELLIAPTTTDLIKSRRGGLDLETVNRVIDELVPLAARGKFVIERSNNTPCPPSNDCAGSTRVYEKVSIYYNAAPVIVPFKNAPPEDRVNYAVVKWNYTMVIYRPM